ncbi:MAG: TrgA family protein [Marinibacterium sp.]
MPTAARLVAAVCLAGLAFLVSGEIVPLLPEGTYVGRFGIINALVGLVCGWVVMGPRAGRGIVGGINNGLTGVVVLMFWGLFIHSANEMVRQAMRNYFDGPFEAIMSIFTIGFDYAKMIFSAEVVVTLIVGGVVSGLATEYASRKWR